MGDWARGMMVKDGAAREPLPDYLGARTDYRPVLSNEDAPLCAGSGDMG